MTCRALAEEQITGSIIGAFYEVYNTLDSGYLERLYVLAMERELLARGHNVSREHSVRVMYKGETLGRQRLDMVVDDRVVVEVKSTDVLSPMATRQLMSYLRGTRLEVGLVLHFGPKARFVRVFCENRRARREE